MNKTLQQALSYKSNLSKFYNSLAGTPIKFFFFFAKEVDSDNTYVKDYFKVFKPKHQGTSPEMFSLHYIAPGVQDGYYYIFKESHLKYVLNPGEVRLRLLPRNPHREVAECKSYPVPIPAHFFKWCTSLLNPLKSAAVKRANNEYALGTLVAREDGDINHGDHVDFGLTLSRQDGVIVKTHKTVYTEDMMTMTYTRNDDQQCNFPFVADLVNTYSYKQFITNTRCFSISQSQITDTRKNMTDSYIQDSQGNDKSCIYCLCKAMIHGSNMTDYVEQLGGKKHHLQVCRVNDKHCKLYTGPRGGKYIQHNRSRHKRKYLKQRGGVYKSIDITDPTTRALFEDFIYTNIMQRVKAAREDLEQIMIIHDELNQFGGAHHLLVFYDFNDGLRNIFYLELEFVMKAFYVHMYETSNLAQQSNAPNAADFRASEEFKRQIIPVIKSTPAMHIIPARA